MKGTPAGIPLPTLLLVVFASTLCLLLLAYLGYILCRFWRGLDQLELKDRFAIKNDVTKTTAQILGGAFFLFGLYFTWSNLVATQEKNITDLYTKAIEQLGSDRLEVRLGGIYALERIARQSEKDHGTIMEVLIAYVRENAPWPPETLAEARKKRSWAKTKDEKVSPPERWGEITIKPDADVQAVLTVIGRRSRTYEKGEKKFLDLRKTDLRGAELRDAHLEGANLVKAHLEGADFWKARLEGAKLRYADLKKAEFWEAHLDGADLMFAHLEGAHFWKAHLEGANFQNTDLRLVRGGLKAEQLRPARNWVLAYLPVDELQKLSLPPDHNQRLESHDLSSYNLAGMDLREAMIYLMNLQGVNFHGTNLEEAIFYDCNLEKANLEKANLKGANFTRAKGLTREQLAGALNVDENLLPDYLKKPQPEKPESK